MPAFIAPCALLPEGWAHDVHFEVSTSGHLEKITIGGSSEGAERLRGPVLPGMPNVHSHAFQRAMAGLAGACVALSRARWTLPRMRASAGSGV